MHIQIKIAKYQKLVLNWQFTLLTSRRITTVIVLNNGCCMDDHRPATPEAGRGCGQRCDPNVRAPARVSRHGRPADQRANARMRKRGTMRCEDGRQHADTVMRMIARSRVICRALRSRGSSSVLGTPNDPIPSHPWRWSRAPASRGHRTVSVPSAALARTCVQVGGWCCG
jgi:hypothetical protein